MSTPANTDFRVFGSENQAFGRRGTDQTGSHRQDAHAPAFANGPKRSSTVMMPSRRTWAHSSSSKEGTEVGSTTRSTVRSKVSTRPPYRGRGGLSSRTSSPAGSHLGELGPGQSWPANKVQGLHRPPSSSASLRRDDSPSGAATSAPLTRPGVCDSINAVCQRREAIASASWSRRPTPASNPAPRRPSGPP